MEKNERMFGARISDENRSLIKFVLAMVIAFASSFGKVLHLPADVNVAVAAVLGNNAIGAFAGSLLAYVISGTLGDGIVQLCSILVLIALRFINPLGSHRNEPIYVSLATTAVLILFNSVMCIAMSDDGFTASLRMVSSLMCGCIVYILKTISVNRDKNGVYDLTGINGIFIGIIYMMVVSTLSSIPMPVINLGRILGTFTILITVKKYKNFYGAGIGALTTCGILISTPLTFRNTLLLAAVGLVCGAFTRFGTLITVLSMLFATLIGLVSIGVNSDTYNMLADVAIGSIVFLLIPSSVYQTITKKVIGIRSSLDVAAQVNSSKLNFASQTLSSIRRQLSLITVAMDKKKSDVIISENVKFNICKKCELYSICFKTDNQTLSSFFELEKILKTDGLLKKGDVHSSLPLCINKAEIIDAFNNEYALFEAERTNSIRTREMREFLIQQISSMEDILNDLAVRSSQFRNIDVLMTIRVKELFMKFGYDNAKVNVYIDENYCQRVDVYLNVKFNSDILKVTTGVSSVTDCDMDVPTIIEEDGSTKISFCEMTKFTVETSTYSASASGEYSGDSYDIINVNGTEKYIILSDGMGTGKRARLDSIFSVSLLTRLLNSGISMETAHKLLNSMLMVKGWEESFATLDLVKIDMNSGSANFLKAGAVDSWLCRDGCTKKIGGGSFPMGILSECLPYVNTMKLFDGDYIFLTSDGVDEDSAHEYAKVIASNSKNPIDELVQKVGKMALSKRGKESDDLTFILIKIKRRSEI